VVIGTSPFIGFHLVICLVAATLFGLNRAVTYLAANISLPAFAPALAFASIQVGNRLLTGSWLAIDRITIANIGAWAFAEAWLLGSLVVGLAIGAPAGLIVAAVVALYRRRHPLPPDPVQDAMTAAADRYAPQGRFTLGYIRGKLTHDPVYRQLAESTPLTCPVVDVGCGRGQTLLLLKERQPDLTGIGLDWDERKLTQARRAAEGVDGLRYRSGDARAADYPEAGTLLLIDVLHYSMPAEQEEMLRRAVRALRPGGRIFVRDVDNGAGWRAVVTRWQEQIGRWTKFNRGATLSFVPAAATVSVLRASGLDVRVLPSWGSTPFANVLIEGRKPSPSA
jgi:SAM-dependent methyltransferase